MKTCLVMAVICFILYQTPQVRGSCVSCKYGTPEQKCKDVFVPGGSETFDDVCTKINADLCKKYGDYAIYCRSGSSSFNCQKKGLCGSGTLTRLTPILLLASIIINVLM